MTHVHVPARRVAIALVVTLAAAGIELAGSFGGGSLFLAADAVHLLAHTAIFLVLLIPPGVAHERGEDVAALTVLALVLLIAAGMIRESLAGLRHPPAAPPAPSVMLLSLLGLAANLVTARLFADPARERWSFRAALAHELADASLTIAGLAGAAAIACFGWRRVDPGLSFAIGAWLAVWATRLLVRRVRSGGTTWAHVD